MRYAATMGSKLLIVMCQTLEFMILLATMEKDTLFTSIFVNNEKPFKVKIEKILRR